MLKTYNSILATVREKVSSKNGSPRQSQTTRPTEFHLFADLPPELRIRIWSLATPARIIEASLKYAENSWRCHISKTRQTSPGSRQISALFSVSTEARQICLDSYVPFCGNYIHRHNDIVYISWQQSQPGSTIQHISDSKPIDGQPFSQLHTVAITLMRNTEFDDTRFGALISCLRSFGTPRKLLLSLVGPNVPDLFSDITGFSISSGKNVVLLNWPNKVEEHMGESVRGHVMEALEAEKSNTPDFKIPIVDGRLRYITVSNPSRHLLRDPLPF